MIEAIGLTKRYGSTTAVNDLSFTVQPGVVTGFLGPNGAGKSTTMRMILGLDRPDGGEVLLDGKRYRELRRALTTVGALLDAKWVHPNRSARGHLRWLAKSNGLAMSRADEVIEAVGLASVAKRRAGGFSLGMSQRLGIAGALLGNPRVLLFDEPVNGLDPEGILWIRLFLQRLAAEGRTVFVSSHLLSEMALTAEELVVIGRGKLIAQCSTTEFVDRASRKAVLVRSPEAGILLQALEARGLRTDPDEEDPTKLLVRDTTTEEVGEIAGTNGVFLHELTQRQISLEQAFMRITGDSVEYHAEVEPVDDATLARTGD